MVDAAKPEAVETDFPFLISEAGAGGIVGILFK